MDKNEIILYETADHTVKLNVNTDGDTVWLNRAQLAELFDRDIKTIGKHINNALKEELTGDNSVVAKFATTAADGKTYQMEYYNLDVIISVGYRVKSLDLKPPKIPGGLRKKAAKELFNQLTHFAMTYKKGTV